MSKDQWVGSVTLFLMTWPIWSPRWRRARKQIKISREWARIGPSWSEDEPMIECFDEEE